MGFSHFVVFIVFLSPRFVPMTTAEIIVSLWAGTRGFLDKALEFLGDGGTQINIGTQTLAGK